MIILPSVMMVFFRATCFVLIFEGVLIQCACAPTHMLECAFQCMPVTFVKKMKHPDFETLCNIFVTYIEESSNTDLENTFTHLTLLAIKTQLTRPEFSPKGTKSKHGLKGSTRHQTNVTHLDG